MASKPKATPVIFRVEELRGRVVAVFPDLPVRTGAPGMLCYLDDAYGSCSVEAYAKTRPASRGEYAAMADHLSARFGLLDIRHRLSKPRNRNA